MRFSTHEYTCYVHVTASYIPSRPCGESHAKFPVSSFHKKCTQPRTLLMSCAKRAPQKPQACDCVRVHLCERFTLRHASNRECIFRLLPRSALLVSSIMHRASGPRAESTLSIWPHQHIGTNLFRIPSFSHSLVSPVSINSRCGLWPLDKNTQKLHHIRICTQTHRHTHTNTSGTRQVITLQYNTKNRILQSQLSRPYIGKTTQRRVGSKYPVGLIHIML